MTSHPDLIIGLDQADDAGVYMTPAGDALVQTVDFFTPIVDEPFDWGRIAAANALSDVYAMGGEPITALQLVSWPRSGLGFDGLEEVIAGGASVLEAAGCTLVGGHSVDDQEPKYGFAVTGIVRPGCLTSNAGARVGDRLVLTKPLGTGVISSAIKQGQVSADVRDAAVASMARLNDTASRAMTDVEAHAATDVTGFGLLGHLRELLDSADVAAVIDVATLPILPGAWELLEAGVFSGVSQRNLDSVAPIVHDETDNELWARLTADAQTSGGLLITTPAATVESLVELLETAGDTAAVIGEIVAGSPAITLR